MDASSSVPPKPKTAGSRVTLVCAECKRQKLKCDRREPCSTCRKRGTESKCEYSAEAADRIDNQSLANRIASLEATIQNLVNNPAAARNAAPQDPTPLAIGNTGGSLALSFKDTSRVWMEHLDILKDVTLHPTDQDNQVFNSIPTVSDIMFDRLPADKPDRETLLDHLEKTMAMHPCFHFPHFRQRVNLMFEHPDESPSQSFFALAAVGFALGAQSWIEAQQADIGDKGKAPMAYDARELWELSKDALLAYETSSAPDYDSLTAMVLQILYLLHDGETRVEHTVFPLVGKMINTARAMGLQVDPTEYAKGCFTVFEAEMRRRLWWTVYYYDLFVSDYMSVPPLIADDSYSCHLPKDTDEDKFNPESAEAPIARSDATHSFSFFLQRISVAKLVKSSKQHANRDYQNNVASIETAREIEQMAKAWINSLPETFRLNTDLAKLKGEPLLVAQRCELASIAHQLIITTYAPYLATRHPDPDGIRACLDSAHCIIRAAETIYSVLKQTRPAAYMFYSFGNQLFHAAIIAAHSVISDPRSEIAQTAMQHVTTALALMSDPALPSGRPVKGPGGDMAGQPGEALRVVKMLNHRAETALTMVAADSLNPGFRIPYVGAGVSTRQSVRTFPKAEASQNLAAAASSVAQSQQASQRPVEQQVEVTPSSDAMDTTPSSQWGSEDGFHDLSHHGNQSVVERPNKRTPSLSVRQRGQLNAKDARGGRGKPPPRRQMTAVPIPNPHASINRTPASTSLPNLPGSPAPGTSQFYASPGYTVEEAKPAPTPQQYTFTPPTPYDFATYQPAATDSQQPPPAQPQQQPAFYYPPATQTPGAYHENGPFMSGLTDPMNANMSHQLARDAPYPMAEYNRWEGDAGQQAQPIPQAATQYQWSAYHQQG